MILLIKDITEIPMLTTPGPDAVRFTRAGREGKNLPLLSESTRLERVRDCGVRRGDGLQLHPNPDARRVPGGPRRPCLGIPLGTRGFRREGDQAVLSGR